MTSPPLRPPPVDFVLTDLTEQEFILFRDLISAKTGISLRDTKRSMLSARLHRRLRALSLENFELYYQHLLKNDPYGLERRELINCVTTNKTAFFREQHHFAFLAQLLEKSNPSHSALPFNVWSAACSTGEEPYSIAMTIRDVLDRGAAKRDFKVLATDIDTQVLQFAKSAIYLAADLEPIPTPLRQRFFLRGSGSQDGRFRVKPDLREQIEFRQLNLIDPVWEVTAGLDVIFCRNALIYFEHETQNRILRRLIGYLKPHGYLIVGHSEHLHWMTDILETVGTTAYRLKHGAKGLKHG